jgi:hypothetical protein
MYSDTYYGSERIVVIGHIYATILAAGNWKMIFYLVLLAAELLVFEVIVDVK